jgi:magnesium-transporting ATPase (P-type)
MFEEYQDLNNGIYCISSAAFNFLYKNKSFKGIQFLLQKLDKNAKIFFNMSSLDKSTLIDYYRESNDNVVCSLGKCDSDLDAIISSNVGLSLKNPPNQNMILCHFYSEKKDIISLKSIITIGRLLYENSILLEIVSFSCCVSINFFLIECLMETLSIEGVLKNELRFLDLEFLILELFSFAGAPEEKKNMIKNKKLLNLYYIVQLTALLLFKLFSIILLYYLYKYENTLDPEEQSYEYTSFFFILCVEFVINSIFIFNHISFYREAPFSNLLLVVSSLVIFIYVILLICFNSSNYHSDFLGLSKFAFSEYLMDTYTDQNRMWLTVILCFDFSGSFLFCSILYLIFNCCAK